MFGFLSNENLPFGWIRPDHPLQQDTALHIGLRIGLFGSLTTCKCDFSGTPRAPTRADFNSILAISNFRLYFLQSPHGILKWLK
jgi:hypothetical protein